MDFEGFLGTLGGEISLELEKVLDEKVREAGDSPPFMKEVYSHVREYILRRGKRLASSCTVMAFKGIRRRVDKEILRAASSVEFFRHSILVHDDLVDEDNLRRGLPSTHAFFRRLHGEKFQVGNPERFGNSMAVFVGNMLFALACETLCSAGFGDHPTREGLHLLSRNFRLVNDSQVLDLLFESYEPSEEEWFMMARTRAPTLFETSVLLGATLAEASRTQVEKLGEYARNIGYAFDIQDDIIGSFASQDDYGRPTTGDIILGKKTLFIIKTLKKATESEKAFMRRVLGSREAAKQEVEKIKALAVRTGALEEAKETARKMAEQAVKTLDDVGISGEALVFFRGLGDFIVRSMKWYV